MPENLAKRLSRAYLSLGSNLGQRKEQLQQAVALLRRHPAIQAVQCSSLYQTKPCGPVEQAPFWNICLKLELNAPALLAGEDLAAGTMPQRCAQLLLEYCLHCEKQLGRDRSVRWGPRSIDIDLIDYQRLELHSKTLDLPHPHFLQRLFVLVPLAEIADRDFLKAYSLRQQIQRLEAENPAWGYKIAEVIA